MYTTLGDTPTSSTAPTPTHHHSSEGKVATKYSHQHFQDGGDVECTYTRSNHGNHDNHRDIPLTHVTPNGYLWTEYLSCCSLLCDLYRRASQSMQWEQ